MSFTFVQSRGLQATSTGTSLGLAYSSNVTSGNLLVVFADVAPSTDANNPTVGISDTLGSSYGSPDVTNFVHAVSEASNCSIWHATAPSSGANTVTITSNDSSTYISIAIFEFSFTGTLSVDGTGSGGNYTTNASSGTLSTITLTATDLVVSGWDVFTSGGTYSTTNSGFTIGPNSTSSAGEPFCSTYNAAVSGASIAPQLSWTVNCFWNGVAAAYKTTAAGSVLIPYWPGRSTLKPKDRPLSGPQLDYLHG
jgi:hypothetical protein